MRSNVIPFKPVVRISRKGHTGKAFTLNGRPFACSACAGAMFSEGQYTAITMVYSLICGNCSHVDYFKKLPKLQTISAKAAKL
jgi:hypothetical protein